MNAPFLTPGMAESETLKPSTQWAKNAEAFFHLAIRQFTSWAEDGVDIDPNAAREVWATALRSQP